MQASFEVRTSKLIKMYRIGSMKENMSRPTAKDLAEAAGVSLATVDRVLNERPNVSSRSKEKVHKAIENIGFVRNLAAVNLARNRTYAYRFIFPTSGDLYLQEILRHVLTAVEDLKSDLTDIKYDQIEMHDPHSVAKFLLDLDINVIDGIAIMAPESPQVRDAITRLHERGLKVVQFQSGQENLENSDFVGSDNCAAGATAGRIISKFLGKRSGKIMVVTDTMQSLNNIQRRLGFDKVIGTHFPTFVPLPTIETYGDSARAEKTITRQLQYERNLVAVYVMSSESRDPLMNRRETRAGRCQLQFQTGPGNCRLVSPQTDPAHPRHDADRHQTCTHRGTIQRHYHAYHATDDG